LTTKHRFQVLSIDGGGVRGIFAAAMLAKLEEDLGQSVLDHFDLVVGTSTGGVIAASLGIGKSPREITDAYASSAKVIFPPHGSRFSTGLFRSKYSPRGMEEVVRREFGDALLADSKVPLVIPSFDIGENKLHLFKTPHHPRLRRDWKIPLWEVAMATSAAPVFFPAFRVPGEHLRLIDGGVWANNPSMVGVAEAVSMFGQPLESIRVLSVGTTADVRVGGRGRDRGGLIPWLRPPNLLNTVLAGQSASAVAQVQHLLGPSRIRRFDALAPKVIKLDGTDVRDLLAKAAHHSRVFCPEFEEFFADHVAPPYKPIYGPNAES
jgi:patatin-like phospholipase/acyl hydrolase